MISNWVRRLAVPTMAAVAVLVVAAPAMAAIPYGPGPKSTYTVQRQPAPGTCHYRWINKTKGYVLPDVHCTPGALNPKVVQKTLRTTVCVSGYTTKIRPPSSITSKEKTANAKSYSYTGSFSTGEYDHLVPLEIGGDPNDARNLFVEPNKSGATHVNNPKDPVENYLHTLVCDYVHLASHHQGSATSYLPLARAQQLIDSNWTTAKSLAPRYLVKA